MKIGDFRVRPGRKFRLRDWPTRVKSFYASEEDYAGQLKDGVKELDDLQKKLYASGRYALLVVFQAMDAGGKDSAIRHVFSGINPQGCHVTSFKQPGPEELKRDFLWRTNLALPARGMIGVFNRSHYEEVTVLRVHPGLLTAEGVPEADRGKGLWKDRCRSIAEWESHLHRNNTRIVKIFLHLSKEEQRKRLLARIDQPEKNWKFSMADLDERNLWKDYMIAYEDCIAATSTEDAPWYSVPADDKKNARLIISRIITDTLRGLKLAYPVLEKAKQKELLKIRKLLGK
jgi:PPK2 family polyphosphate:nucleotide phosphotransferase